MSLVDFLTWEFIAMPQPAAIPPFYFIEPLLPFQCSILNAIAGMNSLNAPTGHFVFIAKLPNETLVVIWVDVYTEVIGYQILNGSGGYQPHPNPAFPSLRLI